MTKQIIAMYRAKGWKVYKAKVFIKEFLWLRNIWVGSFLSEFLSNEYIFESPKGKKVLKTKQAFDRLMAKVRKRLDNSNHEISEEEFELLATLN